MAKITVRCPKCSAAYDIDEKHVGRRGRCKKCQTRFVITSPADDFPPATIGRASSPEASPQAGHTVGALSVEDPNTVSCYYVRTLGGIPRVFAEYVEGGSLKEWIDSGRLYEGGPEKALERILDVAIQFAWGLHYADEKGLIHQDVKPANVMMTPEGVAKVTDFGLAKARAAAGEVVSADTQRSILVSSGGMTPAYCSPEQANKEKLSRKTDIWSWAVSVLEMFEGQTPPYGPAAPELLENFLRDGAEDQRIRAIPETVVELLPLNPYTFLSEGIDGQIVASSLNRVLLAVPRLQRRDSC